MKNFLRFIGNRIVPITALMCITSAFMMFHTFNMKTTVIEYNDEFVSIQTVPSMSTSEILELVDIKEDLTQITSEETNGNVVSLKIFDLFPININVDGTTKTMSIVPMTTKDILEMAEITMSELDIIDTDLDLLHENTADISITRVSKTRTESTQYLDYQTIKRATSTLDFGVTQTKTQGQKGEKLIISEVVLHDGIEISNQVIEEKTLKQPVNEIIEYGSFNVSRGVTERDGVIITSAGQELKYSKVIDVEASAYSTEGWTSKNTASGTVARVGAIAVDPRVIPLGSKLYITSPDGKSWIYGHAVAEDTGGAIKGNKIDLFFNTQSECIKFGRKQAKVYVLS